MGDAAPDPFSVIHAVDRLSRVGHDSFVFIDEVVDQLRSAVPNSATCVATFDPSTTLLTGAHKYGDLAGRDGHDMAWGLLEYNEPEATSFTELAHGGRAVATLHQMTDGDLSRSPRHRNLIGPYFGYGDELRVVAQSQHGTWGGIALFRSLDERPFTSDEVDTVAALSQPIAQGIQSGYLVRSASPSTKGGAPLVLVVDCHDQVTSISAGADDALRSVARSKAIESSAVLGGMVAAARRFRKGTSDVLPRARLRLADDTLAVATAAPLDQQLGSSTSDDVVVTVTVAGPPAIVPLVVAALGLTHRERMVTQLVLQGVSTKQIAIKLSMSAYTVQDHLKSVFVKAGVRSRRELFATVFFDHYRPRLGHDVDPSGWFEDPGIDMRGA